MCSSKIHFASVSVGVANKRNAGAAAQLSRQNRHQWVGLLVAALRLGLRREEAGQSGSVWQVCEVGWIVPGILDAGVVLGSVWLRSWGPLDT